MSMTRAEMLAHIDTKAGAVRSRYITVSPGQEATYILKGNQAREFAAKAFGGAPPSLIAAEASALGETPKVAAKRIMAEEAAWASLAGTIEGIRRTGKMGVQNASTEIAATQAFEQTIKTFSAML